MAPSDIEVIKGYLELLAQHRLLPDDSGQAVIDRVGDTRDPSSLPILRQVLKACIGYKKWAESLPREQPGLWIYELLASKMETRLRVAIEKCTPQGEPVVYAPIEVIEKRTPQSEPIVNEPKRKWWHFWK